MSISTGQLPAETDRITRAMFEHASLISLALQLEELVGLNAEFAGGDWHSPVRALPAALCAHVDAWAAGAEQYDDMTVAGLRVRD